MNACVNTLFQALLCPRPCLFINYPPPQASALTKPQTELPSDPGPDPDERGHRKKSEALGSFALDKHWPQNDKDQHS